MTARPGSRGADQARSTPARDDPDDEPVLPTVSRDQRGEEWGDGPGERDEDWYRRERPPHHE